MLLGLATWGSPSVPSSVWALNRSVDGFIAGDEAVMIPTIGVGDGWGRGLGGRMVSAREVRPRRSRLVGQVAVEGLEARIGEVERGDPVVVVPRTGLGMCMGSAPGSSTGMNRKPPDLL